MGDYIERAAALNVNFKIPTRFSESKLTTTRKAVQEYANEIAKIPAADVRPVVLCRDCIFRSNEWTGCPKLNGTITDDEFFCKCGIKREGS